jgi:hypothetical protein
VETSGEGIDEGDVGKLQLETRGDSSPVSSLNSSFVGLIVSASSMTTSMNTSAATVYGGGPDIALVHGEKFVRVGTAMYPYSDGVGYSPKWHSAWKLN